jgi:biopolymer transport protein ExbB
MKSMIPMRSGLTALFLSVSLVAHAGDWAHKQKVTIDTTATGAELKQEVAQLPVAVRLHSGNFTFADAKPDGSDLRFMSADGKTPLKFHLEQYDAPNELAMAWVQVPRVPGNAKSAGFVVEWGKADAASSADAKGTYDAAQIFALHLSGPDVGRDSTGNGNNAQAAAGKPVAAGPLGASIEFDGATRMLLPASQSLRITPANGFTFTAWVKPAAADSGKLMSMGALSVGIASGTPVVSLGGTQVKGNAPLKPGIWQHVAVTAAAGKVSLFVDGMAAGNGDLALTDLAGVVVLADGFRGELDEIGLAGVARSADYVKALAVSQAAESPMVNFDEEAAEEGISYISILLGAVTIDGWIVIGILIVMFVISVVVMIGKAQYLSRVKKGNAEFLERFAESSAEMLTPGTPIAQSQADDPTLRHSSITRLYAVGLREIAHRFEAMRKQGDAPALSGPALDSIRASLDATQIREGQRINSQIVLLTIAISGGPFLGLLGTVVGVMITFAAIAAAGDVNVNSIAPGIAAALVATVAGLAVAIPALFGYNWLAAQIKNVTADMSVFADEFITKAAELHSR